MIINCSTYVLEHWAQIGGHQEKPVEGELQRHLVCSLAHSQYPGHLSLAHFMLQSYKWSPLAFCYSNTPPWALISQQEHPVHPHAARPNAATGRLDWVRMRSHNFTKRPFMHRQLSLVCSTFPVSTISSLFIVLVQQMSTHSFSSWMLIIYRARF